MVAAASPPRHAPNSPNRPIQDRIKRFIIDQGFRPGDPLPPEAELARVLGVSRLALREAIKSLQPLGIIETRHGAGTFVGHFSLDSLVDGLAFSIRIDLGQNMRTIRELLELREAIEAAFVVHVAVEHTAEQLIELNALVSTMETLAARGDIFPEEDRAFHEALYRPLGNDLLVKLLHAFWDVYYLVRDQLAGGHGLVPSVVTAADHRRILDAVAAGDAAAARAAMIDHFDGIKRRFSETSETSETAAEKGGNGSVPATTAG